MTRPSTTHARLCDAGEAQHGTCEAAARPSMTDARPSMTHARLHDAGETKHDVGEALHVGEA